MDGLVKEILTKVSDAPLPSGTALKILKLFSNPAHSIRDVYEIVNCDPVLAAECIKLVNSVSFGLTSQITSVDRATQYIGLLGLLQISLKHSNGPFLSQALPGYELMPGSLWKESLFGAAIAKKLAPVIDKKLDGNLAFTGGLFRDLGKWIISAFLNREMEKARQILKLGTTKDFLELEMECLGTTHCEIGSYLADHWSLPKIFKDCVLFHHHPELYTGSDSSLLWCVHFADALCRMQMPENFEGLDFPFHSRKLNEYELNSTKIEKIIFEAKLEYDSLEAKFATT